MFMQNFLKFTRGFDKFTSESSTPSYGLGCSGIDIFGPRMRFEDNRMLMEIKLDTSTTGFTPNVHDPKYCDDINGDAFMTNPHFIESSSSNDFAQFKYNLKKEMAHDMPYYLGNFMSAGWLDAENTSAKHIVSPIIHAFTSHFYMQDYCRQNHPEADISRCAFVASFLKKNNLYDRKLEA